VRAVNLLPSEHAPKRRGAPVPVIVGCAGAVVAVGALAAGYLQASSKIGGGTSELANLQSQIAALPQPAPLPSTITGLPSLRSERLAAVSTALSQRIAWDRILREVSLVLPDDVWLTSLEAQSPNQTGGAPTPPPAPGTAQQPTGFQLDGFTYSQAAVARLLSRLNLIPDLEDVTLTGSVIQAPDATAGPNAPTVVQFTIAGNVRAAGATS
jgi:Tfp pilus assembly protein PilN